MGALRYLVIILILLSCKGRKDGPKPNEYHNHLVNWTITLPEGWSIKRSFTNHRQDTTYSFTRGRHNELSFLVLPYTEYTPGKYLEEQKMLDVQYCQTVDGTGIKADTSSGTETIGGFQFHTFYYTAYTPFSDRPVIKLAYYYRLIGGYNFRASIFYNNDATFKEIHTAFKNSQFH